MDDLSYNKTVVPSKLSIDADLPIGVATTTFTVGTVLDDGRILLCVGEYVNLGTDKCWTYDSYGSLSSTEVATSSTRRWVADGTMMSDGKFWLTGGDHYTLMHYIDH